VRNIFNLILVHDDVEKFKTVNSPDMDDSMHKHYDKSEEKQLKKTEIKQKLENLVNDNNSLKKSVVLLYRKYEVKLLSKKI